MFTGLVEAVGHIDAIVGNDDGKRLTIRTPLAGDLAPGDSIAVSGVCLTVTSASAGGFTADVSRETLSVTALGTAARGRSVNLERPVRADARMGGHFVLGHVDGVGRIATWRPDGDAYWLDVDVPPALLPLVISRGSIAIDGISLTVAAIADGRVGAQIVPFTRAHTSLADAAVGDVVNLEADVLGKYVARLLALSPLGAAEPSPMGQS